MGFNGENPLRGWKEICPFLGVGDPRTAKQILIEKHLLVYEGRMPVLIASEYLRLVHRKEQKKR